MSSLAWSLQRVVDNSAMYGGVLVFVRHQAKQSNAAVLQRRVAVNIVKVAVG